MKNEQGPPRPEPFITVQAAAEVFNIPKFKLQRAVRLGLIPAYAIYNKRKLIRISEVIAVIESSRTGGLDDAT